MNVKSSCCNPDCSQTIYTGKLSLPSWMSNFIDSIYFEVNALSLPHLHLRKNFYWCSPLQAHTATTYIRMNFKSFSFTWPKVRPLAQMFLHEDDGIFWLSKCRAFRADPCWYLWLSLCAGGLPRSHYFWQGWGQESVPYNDKNTCLGVSVPWLHFIHCSIFIFNLNFILFSLASPFSLRCHPL